MSDDTTRTDDWGATERPGAAPESGTQSGTQSEGPRVGFCQDCGRPLTQENVRTVGTGVFCEPCLAARVRATIPASGYTGYTAVPPYSSAVPPQAVTSGDPSPVLAAILGFIPGVGAMYNGQFAKGIVHLLIFAILVSLSSNVNGIFGLFVAGWIFYMAFEAYHTAIARRDGLPLPNAFGFNDIGERMGFGKSWGGVGAVRDNESVVPPSPPSTAQAADPTVGTGYVPVNPVPVGTAPDWVGYVPPTAFGSGAAHHEAMAASMAAPMAAPMAAQLQAQAMRDADYGHVPYAETYVGAPSAHAPAVGGAPDPSVRRFPTGALWLIGLGVLILIANLLPDWKLTEQWWAPVFLAGLSIWLLTRRLQSGARWVCIIRWPVILMVLAAMLALHAAYVPVTVGLTGSVLLIVLGALLLLERTAGASPVYAPPIATAPYPATASGPDAQAEEARSRAAWAAPGGDGIKSDPDGTKGGQ